MNFEGSGSDSSVGSAKALFSLLSSSPANNINRNSTSAASKFPIKPQHPHLRTSVAATADFLDALRSRSLLDYKFMRDFSLARHKPVQERSLAKLSANSVYSMRMAQLSLDEQGRTFAGRQQWLMRPEPLEIASALIPTESIGASKGDDELRAPCSPLRDPAHKPNSTRFKRNHTQNAPSSSCSSEKSAAVSCFPTLWGERTLATTSGENSGASHYDPTATKRSAAATAACHHQSQPPAAAPRGAAPQTAALDCQELSEPGKCHPSAVVADHHGFLSEQDIPALMEQTGYSRTELYALWARFKALCSISRVPEGIDRDTFHRGLPQLSVEDDFFIDRVFTILDADGSGILEWQEFVEALSSLEKGDVAKRVGFLFRVYDLNGDNTIHRGEATQFFLASLLVTPTDDVQDVTRHFVDKIFAAVGCGDKDAMRIEDAMAYMRDHPATDIYSLFGRTMVPGRQQPLVPIDSTKLPRPVRSHSILG